MAALPSVASRSLRADEGGSPGEARRSSGAARRSIGADDSIAARGSLRGRDSAGVRGSLEILDSIGVRGSLEARAAAVGARSAAGAPGSTTVRGRPSIGDDTLGDWRTATGARGSAVGRSASARDSGGVDVGSRGAEAGDGTLGGDGALGSGGTVGGGEALGGGGALAGGRRLRSTGMAVTAPGASRL